MQIIQRGSKLWKQSVCKICKCLKEFALGLKLYDRWIHSTHVLQQIEQNDNQSSTVVLKLFPKSLFKCIAIAISYIFLGLFVV